MHAHGGNGLIIYRRLAILPYLKYGNMELGSTYSEWAALAVSVASLITGA